ncbi:sensor histidine kinase [Clostridium manihotivorum]|uniref:histidine kinase n=1 Tax=Clostridium manihotivorum TaxID=2320868 RepID=A0A3R5TE32_9CLOT|nr:HAMP domain-containing sensor histidine kinase [Clostridium manihotivorum]QAA31273.1 two-component sensor histidine kinase [Clostridium manihotivorum]
MRSIKYKITIYFLVAVFFTVTLLEVLFIFFLRRHYYDNTEALLVNQLKTSADFYRKYCYSSSLVDNIYDNVDVFWKQTNAQVQVLDLNGKLIADSIGVKEGVVIHDDDVRKALKGEKGRWIGRVYYDSNEVMAVSYPLMSGNKMDGVLRFITSLKEVNKSIRAISILFISIGVMVFMIGVFLSYILANSIVNPIKEVTKVAERMAVGDLLVRSNSKRVDEIGSLANTLDYMAEELKKRDELKNDFISSVSHELRTPLTAIKGWAVVLNNEETDRAMLDTGFKIIEKESDRLSAMVEELLDFSRFVSGKVKLNIEDVDISQLIDYVNVYLRPRAERENIEFTVYCEPDLPLISADSSRLKQVLINLLDNAFKFTDSQGSVLLKVYKAENNLKIEVNDTGCGISKEEIPRVKEKFFKGKNSKSQNGIGLSICDEIIEMHGGTFQINSELNKGTKVLVTIPFEA